jgi:hypothetical protein
MRKADIACGVYPKAIIRNYKENNKREKARAFLEWWTDKQSHIEKSFQFYASEWGKSKSTAYEWIKEFNEYRMELENTCE